MTPAILGRQDTFEAMRSARCSNLFSSITERKLHHLWYHTAELSSVCSDETASSRRNGIGSASLEMRDDFSRLKRLEDTLNHKKLSRRKGELLGGLMHTI